MNCEINHIYEACHKESHLNNRLAMFPLKSELMTPLGKEQRARGVVSQLQTDFCYTATRLAV